MYVFYKNFNLHIIMTPLYQAHEALHQLNVISTWLWSGLDIFRIHHFPFSLRNYVRRSKNNIIWLLWFLEDD